MNKTGMGPALKCLQADGTGSLRVSCAPPAASMPLATVRLLTAVRHLFLVDFKLGRHTTPKGLQNTSSLPSTGGEL